MKNHLVEKGGATVHTHICYGSPAEEILRIIKELDEEIECLALHPRLCEEDGERLMGRLLSDDLTTITSACDEKRQEKLLREGYAKAGVVMEEKQWISISMAQEDTNAVFEKIRAAVEKRKSV
ncbi:MAG: hypothetical protein SCK57_11070 [Bacillota bacterium]|nr:hypothetical protein [Bacillota bacterium]MDW7678192.1 hypothetical protein [Bacillota bacterium]